MYTHTQKSHLAVPATCLVTLDNGHPATTDRHGVSIPEKSTHRKLPAAPTNDYTNTLCAASATQQDVPLTTRQPLPPMLNPYSPLRLSPGLVIDEYGQPKTSNDTPESLPTEPAVTPNLPPNDLNATIDRLAKELEAARAHQRREQQRQQQLPKPLKPRAIGERRFNNTNLIVNHNSNHSQRAGRSRSRSPEHRVPPSKARTVQDLECSAQKDARVHETHQAVLRLYNFHRDKSEPASQLHWRQGEIGTLRQFARSLRQQQLQEVNVRVLEERLRNLTDKLKPNSK